MDLTDKEKQSIRNAIKLLIKDLRKLTDNYPGTIIKVFAFHEEIGRYGSAWYLEITKKEITLKEPKRESDSIIARGNKRNIYIDDAGNERGDSIDLSPTTYVLDDANIDYSFDKLFSDTIEIPIFTEDNTWKNNTNIMILEKI